MKLRNKLARTLPFFAFFLPAGYLLLLIHKYGVDVPFVEQWHTASLFQKLSQGSLTFADLYAQQNEYRQLFPHLLILAVGKLTNWNIKHELYIIFLFACLISFGIYRLGALTLDGLSRWQRLGAFFISNLLIFSPIQGENWVYGIQIVYLMPLACIVLGMVVAYSGASVRAKFMICAALSLVSVFSAVHGILSWVVLLPPLVWSARQVGSKEKSWLIAAWSLCAALCVAAYFTGYQTPAGGPNPFDTFRHPISATLYFFSFLGSPLWAGSLWPLVFVGCLLTTAHVAACLFLWRRGHDEALVTRLLGWLMLGAFSLLTGALAAIGRSGYGLEQSMSARYMAFSLYLSVAVAHAAPIVLAKLKEQPAGRRGHLALSSLAAIALASALAAQARLYPLGTLVMLDQWQEHARAKACLLFVNILPDSCLAEQLIPREVLAERANALNDLGFLRPGLMGSLKLEEVAGESNGAGEFEDLRQDADGAFVAQGWARLPEGRPADATLLAVEMSMGNSVAFRVSELRRRKEFAIESLQEIVHPDLRWSARFSVEDLPRTPATITAWAFDAEKRKAYKLGGWRVVSQPE